MMQSQSGPTAPQSNPAPTCMIQNVPPFLTITDMVGFKPWPPTPTRPWCIVRLSLHPQDYTLGQPRPAWDCDWLGTVHVPQPGIAAAWTPPTFVASSPTRASSNPFPTLTGALHMIHIRTVPSQSPNGAIFYPQHSWPLECGVSCPRTSLLLSGFLSHEARRYRTDTQAGRTWGSFWPAFRTFRQFPAVYLHLEEIEAAMREYYAAGARGVSLWDLSRTALAPLLAGPWGSFTAPQPFPDAYAGATGYPDTALRYIHVTSGPRSIVDPFYIANSTRRRHWEWLQPQMDLASTDLFIRPPDNHPAWRWDVQFADVNVRLLRVALCWQFCTQLSFHLELYFYTHSCS